MNDCECFRIEDTDTIVICPKCYKVIKQITGG